MIVIVSLYILIREIIRFIALDPKQNRSLLYIQACSDILIYRNYNLMKQITGPYYTYDVNYKYVHIPEVNSLTKWCSEINKHVCKTSRFKFTRVTAVYHFKSRELAAFTPMIYKGPPDKHLKIIVPITEIAHLGNMKNKVNVIPVNSLGVVCYPELKVQCSSFILIIVRQFLAWDV
jgi:hypothetical protein